ncbi:hypothetical protein L1856_22130 [Streptomyces sp. Tue 6430]|nr:hypothetical protein [Streptomyces sp. Tue 6430]
MALLLLLVVPGGLVAAFAFTGYAVGSLGRTGLRAADRTVWLRSAAALVAAVAALLYTWGLLHVVAAVAETWEGGTESAPLPPCLTPAGRNGRRASSATPCPTSPSASSARRPAAAATPATPSRRTSTRASWCWP